MAQLTIRTWDKFAEQDDFNGGCLPDTAQCTSFDYQIRAGSVADLIKRCADAFANGDVDAVEIDACEESGRVDVAVTETDDGCAANAADIEAWKRGYKILYYVIYTGYVTVETASGSLRDMT